MTLDWTPDSDFRFTLGLVAWALLFWLCLWRAGSGKGHPMRTFKLCEQGGAYLGTITVPDRCADELQRNRVWSFVVADRLPVTNMVAPMPSSGVLKRGYLEPAFGQPIEGAVLLLGVTLEEFEALPECSFAPSKAYLRRLIAEVWQGTVPPE